MYGHIAMCFDDQTTTIKINRRFHAIFNFHYLLYQRRISSVQYTDCYSQYSITPNLMACSSLEFLGTCLPCIAYIDKMHNY